MANKPNAKNVANFKPLADHPGKGSLLSIVPKPASQQELIESIRKMKDGDLITRCQQALSDLRDDILYLSELRLRFKAAKRKGLGGYKSWTDFINQNTRYCLRTIQRDLKALLPDSDDGEQDGGTSDKEALKIVATKKEAPAREVRDLLAKFQTLKPDIDEVFGTATSGERQRLLRNCTLVFRLSQIGSKIEPSLREVA